MIPAPRDFLVDPTQFGRAGAEWWPGTTTTDKAQTRAARLQHDSMIRLRAHLARVHLTQGEYAEKIGWLRGRLSRVLVGLVWIPLLDLEELLETFGESIASVSFDSLSPGRQAGIIKAMTAAYLRSQSYVLVETDEEEFRVLMNRLRDAYPEIT